jgi:hypothetical protein
MVDFLYRKYVWFLKIFLSEKEAEVIKRKGNSFVA